MSADEQPRAPGLTPAELAPDVAPRCLSCDYPLNDLPEPRCPECGRAFDATDPRTYHRGRPMPPWLKAWLRPIGWRTSFVAGIAWLAMSFFLAQPELTYMCAGLILGLFAWPVLLALIGLRVLVRGALIRRYRRSPAEFGSEGKRLGRIIAAFTLLHISSLFAIPTRAWFLPFAPAFESAAADYRASTPESEWFQRYPMASRTRWIGPWHVTIRGNGSARGAVIFHTGGEDGFVHVNGNGGIVYYGPPGADGWIIGDWYYFAAD